MPKCNNNSFYIRIWAKATIILYVIDRYRKLNKTPLTFSPILIP